MPMSRYAARVQQLPVNGANRGEQGERRSRMELSEDKTTQ